MNKILTKIIAAVVSIMAAAVTILGVPVMAADGATYTGEPITPEITLYDEDVLLVKGVDYTLSYENNINVGTATIIVTFIGNYSGEKRVTFNIIAKTLTQDDVTISTIESQVFTGEEITPKPEIKFGDVTLVENTDYELSYTDNVHAGTATITVDFIGNYSGTVTANFEITAKDVTNDENLTRVVVTFIGNYAGETERTFNIKRRSSGGGSGGSASKATPAPKPNVTDGDGNSLTDNTNVDGNHITITVPDENIKQPITVILPDDKTLTDGNDYEITIINKKKEPLEDIQVIVKDKNNDESHGITDKNGTIIVPNRDYKIEDSKGDSLKDYTEIEDNTVKITLPEGAEEPIIITLPDDKTLTDGTQHTIIIMENGSPKSGVSVIVRDKNGVEATGTTDENGIVIVPDTVIHSPYIKGYTDGTFRPDGNITRAETAAVLSRVMPLSNTGGKTFSDVSSDVWYYEPIMSMSSAGIIMGYTDGTFKPDNNITRAEFVAMLMRNLNVQTFDSLPFTDVSPDLWSADYIYSAYMAGYINGYEDGSFRPDSFITRAEAVKIINGVLCRNDFSNETNPFSDVSDTHWAYTQILEAAVEHQVNK